MGPHLLASELMKEKSGETNERKLNTESYLVPRVTNPTQADCLAKPKVAPNSCRVLLILVDDRCHSPIFLYVRRNSGDIDDRE